MWCGYHRTGMVRASFGTSCSECVGLRRLRIPVRGYGLLTQIRVTAGFGASREVPMNSPLLAIPIVLVSVIGSTLTLINKACKSGHHGWLDPMSGLARHQATTR